MGRVLGLVLVASIFTIGTGCASRFEEYRLITEPQKYNINNLQTSFDLPDLQDETIAILAGIEKYLHKTEETGLKIGFDVRLTPESLGDRRNRSASPADFNDCVKKEGEISYLGQENLSYIPFFGLEKKMGEGELFIEIGLPYAEWNLETGRAGRAVGCFAPDNKAEDSVVGGRVRFGLSGFEDWYKNFFFSYENYDASFANIDVWGLGWALDF